MQARCARRRSEKESKTVLDPTILVSVSLAVMFLAFAASVIVQEPVQNAAVLLDYLLDLLQLVSISGLLGSHCFPKANASIPNELRRVGHCEDQVEPNVLAFVLVDSFGVLDASLIEGAVTLGAGGLSNGNLGLCCHL